jgi:hypothetical protein
MKTKYYNLYVPYYKDHDILFKAIDKALEMGYHHITLTFSSEEELNNKVVDSVSNYCSEHGIGFSTRYHISHDSIDTSLKRGVRGNILKLRKRIEKKVCIVSVDDSLFKFLTPNDAHKFDLVRLFDPRFRTVVKLLDKPIIFEFLLDPNLIKNNWLRRNLFIVKMLLNKCKLIVSQDPSLDIVFPPQQLAYFIYGLVDEPNSSFNVVSTLPMELISKCL